MLIPTMKPVNNSSFRTEHSPENAKSLRSSSSTFPDIPHPSIHAFTLLSLAMSATAFPCFGGKSDAIPPTSVRDQSSQFNQSQWEKYHCYTYADLLEIVPPCTDYWEQYSIGELRSGGFGRDGCHQDEFPCHFARSQVISDVNSTSSGK
jgi:hypothetical protein